MKRLLVVSYHWPPRAGVTALRSLKLASSLRHQGWDVTVATAQHAEQDSSHASEFPSDRVLTLPAWEPHGLYSRLTRRGKDWNAQDCLEVPPPSPHWLDGPARWVRGNLFIPDARAGWIPLAVRKLRRWLAAHPVDAVLTSGPPHTNTWIGYRLSGDVGVPWVADFQDPWTDLAYLKQLPLTPWARRRHQRMEELALRRAWLRTCTSPSWTAALESRGWGPVHFLPWGWDPADLPSPTPVKYRICLGGTLGPDRDYGFFWEGLARWGATAEGALLEVRLAGNLSDGVVRHARHYLGERVKILGPLPRRQWLAEMASAWAVGVVTNRGQPGRLPAKFFEGAATAPLLIVGEEESDAGRLGRRLGHFCPRTAGEVATALETLRTESAGAREARRKRLAPYRISTLARALSERMGAASRLRPAPRNPSGNPNKVDT